MDLHDVVYTDYGVSYTLSANGMVIEMRFGLEAPACEPMETPDTPLPDEGLTCCQQEFATHEQWLQHYKEEHGSWLSK